MEEKKCRFCAMQIPLEAKICPYCRKTIGISTVKKWILGAFCLLIALPFMGRLLMAPSKSNALPSTTSTVTKPLTLNFPPKKEYQHKFKFKTEYEEINNYTSVGFDDMQLGNNLKLRAHFISSGKVITTPETVSVTFVSNTENWRYLEFRPINLLLNGTERISLGVPKNRTSVHSGSVLEQMNIDVPVEIFLKIVNSNSIEGSIGVTKFKFKESQIEALRDFATKMI
ncbi:MAG: hypothetical protein WCG61_02795 [Chlorobium sp.]